MLTGCLNYLNIFVESIRILFSLYFIKKMEIMIISLVIFREEGNSYLPGFYW